jgi:hypothetical protein
MIRSKLRIVLVTAFAGLTAVSAAGGALAWSKVESEYKHQRDDGSLGR